MFRCASEEFVYNYTVWLVGRRWHRFLNNCNGFLSLNKNDSVITDFWWVLLAAPSKLIEKYYRFFRFSHFILVSSHYGSTLRRTWGKRNRGQEWKEQATLNRKGAREKDTDQAEEDEKQLNDVGVGDGVKAAEQRVKYGDQSGRDHWDGNIQIDDDTDGRSCICTIIRRVFHSFSSNEFIETFSTMSMSLMSFQNQVVLAYAFM